MEDELISWAADYINDKIELLMPGYLMQFIGVSNPIARLITSYLIN